MSTEKKFSVWIGNLDERVSDRVLYDILIQAGRVVDLHIPRDKENRPRGFAFAEYETEEIADYAIRLFSGLVTLYNRTLKFGFSGQDKPSANVTSTVMPTTTLSNKETSVSLSTPSRVSSHAEHYSSVPPPPPGVNNHSNGLHLNGNNFEYTRRVIGATLDTISRPRSRRYDMMLCAPSQLQASEGAINPKPCVELDGAGSP